MSLNHGSASVSFQHACLAQHPLRDVVVDAKKGFPAFLQENPGFPARPLEIPSDAFARARFIRHFLKRQAERRARGLTTQLLVLPLGAALLGSGSLAFSAEADWVDAASLVPVVEVIPQTDGSVVLVLPGQQVIRFEAEAVRLEGDAVLVPRLDAYAKGLATPEDAVDPQSLEALPTILAAELGPEGTLTVRFTNGEVTTIEAPQLSSGASGPPAATLEALQSMGIVPVAAQPPSARTLEALAEQPVAAAGNTVLAAGGAMLGGLALALGSSGGGGSDGGAASTPTVPTVPTASNTTGFVIDGYLAGASVTRGTSTVVTNDQGAFSGLGGPEAAPIVVTGGVDITTGQNFTGVLSAPGSATVVTPLTTLVQALVTQGESLPDALSAVASGLGLPSQVTATEGALSLLNFDPLAVLATPGAGDEEKALALEVFKRGVEVATVLQVVADGDEDRFAGLLTPFAEAVAVGGIDPTDGEAITALLTAAGASEAQLAQVPGLVASVVAVREASSVETVALVQQTALAAVPGVAPEDVPPLPAPTLTLPSTLTPEALADGIVIRVAVPAEIAESLPGAARATVQLLDGNAVLATLVSGPAADGVFSLTLPSSALDALSGASFTVSARVSAPGTGLVSAVAESHVALDVLGAVNSAATASALGEALDALQDRGLVSADGNAVLQGDDRLAVLADLLAARPTLGFGALEGLDATLGALGRLYGGIAELEQTIAAAPRLATLEAAAGQLQQLASDAASAGISTFQGAALQPQVDGVAEQVARIALLSPAGREALSEALNDTLILAAAEALDGGTRLSLSDALALAGEAFPAALGVTARLAEDTAAADGVTREGTLLLTAEPNAELAVSLNGGEGFTALAGRSLVLPEGIYEAGALQVRATLGDASVVSTLGTFTVDRTAPSAPTLQRPGVDGVVDDATAQDSFIFSGTAEAGATVKLSWGDAQAETTAEATGAWTITVPGAARPALGETVVRVTATDLAGNQSAATQATVVLKDGQADVGLTVPEQDPDTGTDTGTDAGTDTGTDPGTDTGTDTGTDAGTDTGTDTGTDPGTDTGTGTGTGTGTDTGTDPGPASLVLSSAGTFINAAALANGLTLAGRASNVPTGELVTVVLGTLQGQAPLGATGSWSVTFSSAALSALPAGEVALRVSVPDGEGGTASQSRTLTIDGTAPSATLATSLGAQDVAAFAEALVDARFTLTGTASADTASLTITLQGQAFAATVDGTGAFTLALPRAAFREGSNTLSYRVVDGAGNATEGTFGALTLDRLTALNGFDATTDAPAGYLAALGEATGLAELTLAGLDASGQETVLQALISNRPSGGFSSLTALGDVLEPVAAYAAQFTALRALRSNTATTLDLDAFEAGVGGAVGLTVGDALVSAADVTALDAGLARLGALAAADESQYGATLFLGATLALGGVSKTSLAQTLVQFESKLAGETLVFNRFDLTTSRVDEFQATVAGLGDGGAAVLANALSDVDLGRVARPLEALQTALLQGVREDVRLTETNFSSALLQGAAEDSKAKALAFLDALIGSNSVEGDALSAAEFRSQLGVLQADLRTAEEFGLAPESNFALGAFRFDSQALGRILDVYDALGGGASAATAGQQALTTSLLQQLELDLVDAAAAQGQAGRAGTSGNDALVGTAGNDFFLPEAGDDELELDSGVDTVVLLNGGVGQGTDTLHDFLFGPEGEGGDVLAVPGARGTFTVLPDPVTDLSADGLAAALLELFDDLADKSVTYVLAEEGAPNDGVADVALARVVMNDGNAEAELLLRFIDSGPSLGALDPHNLPDLSGL